MILNPYLFHGEAIGFEEPKDLTLHGPLVMETWVDYIRHCPNCGKGWGKFHWLCAPCEIELFKALKVRRRMIDNGINHFYLFDWKPDDHLKPIVHSIKGGGHRRAVFELVQFCHHPHPGDFIFYPEGKKMDHAWVLGQAFAERFGAKTQGLKVQGKQKQSLLSRSARNKRSFEPLVKPLKRALFVDDIVTTGATVKAAYKALGRPAKMTVWSLFYRNTL